MWFSASPSSRRLVLPFRAAPRQKAPASGTSQPDRISRRSRQAPGGGPDTTDNDNDDGVEAEEDSTSAQALAPDHDEASGWRQVKLARVEREVHVYQGTARPPSRRRQQRRPPGADSVVRQTQRRQRTATAADTGPTETWELGAISHNEPNHNEFCTTNSRHLFLLLFLRLIAER
ncbi:hypothetical protein Vretimale_18752 [Volvox reticuliferus]|uniref:Uncharacterized protein n=1 Tax=Volvox reticuliferus TaxID=1737510 RepID=A0A8J4GYL7_9CHLO|nr:hypothetical protein Vretimale_18752 [Volvox reticuliferus]